MEVVLGAYGAPYTTGRRDWPFLKMNVLFIQEMIKPLRANEQLDKYPNIYERRDIKSPQFQPSGSLRTCVC